MRKMKSALEPRISCLASTRNLLLLILLFIALGGLIYSTLGEVGYYRAETKLTERLQSGQERTPYMYRVEQAAQLSVIVESSSPVRLRVTIDNRSAYSKTGQSHHFEPVIPGVVLRGSVIRISLTNTEQAVAEFELSVTLDAGPVLSLQAISIILLLFLPTIIGCFILVRKYGMPGMLPLSIFLVMPTMVVWAFLLFYKIYLGIGTLLPSPLSPPTTQFILYFVWPPLGGIVLEILSGQLISPLYGAVHVVLADPIAVGPLIVFAGIVLAVVAIVARSLRVPIHYYSRGSSSKLGRTNQYLVRSILIIGSASAVFLWSMVLSSAGGPLQENNLLTWANAALLLCILTRFAEYLARRFSYHISNVPILRRIRSDAPLKPPRWFTIWVIESAMGWAAFAFLLVFTNKWQDAALHLVTLAFTFSYISMLSVGAGIADCYLVLFAPLVENYVNLRWKEVTENPHFRIFFGHRPGSISLGSYRD